jgi:hypothetical protein
MVNQLSPLKRYHRATADIEVDRTPPNAPAFDFGIELPPGCILTTLGLVLPADLPLPEWETLGIALNKRDEAMQWALGDWWCQRHPYGKRAAAVAKGIFRHKFSTLMEYGRVAHKVRTSMRIEALSFAHHQVIAALDPTEQERWLQQATRFKWTVKYLMQSIATNKEWRRTEAEKARDWFRRALEVANRQSWTAMGCSIAEPYGQHVSVDAIKQLTEVTEEAAAAWQRAADCNRAYLTTRKAVNGKDHMHEDMSNGRHQRTDATQPTGEPDHTAGLVR